MALEMLERGSLPSAIMCKFGVSSRFIRNLKNQRATLLKEAERSASSLQSKSLRGGQFPEIEEKVYRFVELARSCKIPVTQSTIKERALLIRNEILKRNDLDNTQLAQIESFTVDNECEAMLVKLLRRLHRLWSCTLCSLQFRIQRIYVTYRILVPIFREH